VQVAGTATDWMAVMVARAAVAVERRRVLRLGARAEAGIVVQVAAEMVVAWASHSDGEYAVVEVVRRSGSRRW